MAFDFKDSEFRARALGIIGGVGLMWTVGEFSTAFDEITANSCSGNGTSDSSTEIGQISSEDPDAVTGTSVLATTIGSMQASSSNPEAVLIIFNKDSVPYTKIERSARKIYNSFHFGREMSGRETAIITESKKGYDMLEQLIYDSSYQLSSDNLEILERVLERIEE